MTDYQRKLLQEPYNAVYYVGNRLRFGEDPTYRIVRHTLLRSELADVPRPNVDRTAEQKKMDGDSTTTFRTRGI